MLSEFESINQKTGAIQGFPSNPLSCVNFFDTFESLGYETNPPQDFGFVKRNIHFATAASTGARNHLPVAVLEVLGDGLQSEPGMVRMSTYPLQKSPQNQLPYEKPYFDVPTVSFKQLRSSHIIPETVRMVRGALLMVPINKQYALSGPGLVSYQNMTYVGLNGIEFRKTNACPEIHNANSVPVKEAWPPDLLLSREHSSYGSSSTTRVRGDGPDEPISLLNM